MTSQQPEDEAPPVVAVARTVTGIVLVIAGLVLALAGALCLFLVP